MNVISLVPILTFPPQRHTDKPGLTGHTAKLPSETLAAVSWWAEQSVVSYSLAAASPCWAINGSCSCLQSPNTSGEKYSREAPGFFFFLIPVAGVGCTALEGTSRCCHLWVQRFMYIKHTHLKRCWPDPSSMAASLFHQMRNQIEKLH